MHGNGNRGKSDLNILTPPTIYKDRLNIIISFPAELPHTIDQLNKNSTDIN